MSKDPFLRDLEHAQQLETQGKTVEAVRIARTILTRERSHPAALHAALIWARADGQNPEAIFAVATSYMFQGKFKEAVQGFDLATKMKPDYAAAYSSQAICIKSLGDLAGSLTLTEKALSLDPKDINAHINMIDTLFDMGNVQEALDYALKIEPQFKNHAGLHTNIARLYGALDRFKESLPHHKKAIKAQPDNPALRINYMAYLFQEAEREELLKELKTTYELFEKSPHYKRLLQQEWYRVHCLNALAKREVLDPSGRILHMRDMDTMGDEYDSLKPVDKQHPVWLFKAHNSRCYSSDWAFYDDENIFMNLKVTGRFFIFLISYGIDDLAYIEEKHFPEVEFNEPGILIGGVDNYYHWLIDYIPRLEAMVYHPELKDLPIYINENVTPFQIETLEFLQIPKERIKYIPRNIIAILKDMYVPYIPGRPTKANGEPDWMKPNENPFIIDWLRKNFVDTLPQVKPTKRYFMSRAGANFRRCLNEDEIFAIAQKYGFEKIKNEGKGFVEQMKMYQEAEAVIGPHGAGFTNILWAPKNAFVLEMFPKSRVLNYYSSIAKLIGQKYVRMEGPIMRTFLDKTPDFGDFVIDAKEFARIMEENFSV